MSIKGKYMEIYGKVVQVSIDTVAKKQDGGTYQAWKLVYEDNRSEIKTITKPMTMLKYNAALANGLQELSVGDNFIMDTEKKDGFVNPTSIRKAAQESTTTNKAQPVAGKAVTNSGSTYATAEERAQTQKYIVRQSSITAALKLIEINSLKKVTAEDVIVTAGIFEAWVFGVEIKIPTKSQEKRIAAQKENDNPFEDMEDDLPL